MRFIATISVFSYEGMVAPMTDKYTIVRIFENPKPLSKYKFSRYVTYIIFHNTPSPSGNHESKLYYNDKHHLYGYNFEASFYRQSSLLDVAIIFQGPYLILICLTGLFHFNIDIYKRGGMRNYWKTRRICARNNRSIGSFLYIKGIRAPNKWESL